MNFEEEELLHPTKKIKRSIFSITDEIEIEDAYENNLKHVNVSIPKGKLVVFAGISGSGKSSLVFDIIANESNRQWQASYPLFIRNKLPHYERPKVVRIKNLTPSIVVDQKTFGATSRSNVGTAIDVAPLIRLLFSRVGKPSAGPSMAYSFNNPMGMCHDCTGIGERLVLNEESIFDKEKSIKEGGIKFSQFTSGWQSCHYLDNPLLDPNKKLKDFSEEEWEILKYGTKKPIKVNLKSKTGITKLNYEAVIPRFKRLYLSKELNSIRKNLQEEVMALVYQGPCDSCHGTGLNPKALASKINGHNIMDYCNMSIHELLEVLKGIDSTIGVSIVKQINYILEKMVEVGLGYLSLGRKSTTLSGGEIQRIKMVRNLGSSLVNITYIFDEPTSGLHPYDAERIGNLLINLRNNHNNVLVVEHSKQIINMADYVIELGPGAGAHGGQIVYQGSLEDMKKKEKTKTSLALREALKLNEKPLSWSESFIVENAKLHNLKNVTVKFPKGILTAITGVAGSGKSSLCQEFIKKYPDTIFINQKPIGISSRSNPATYIGIMDEIRKEFAKENNVAIGLFSFNSTGGCEMCKGKGTISFDMAFADTVKVICEECNGHRYNKKALTYKYKGKTIEEVMSLTFEEAVSFFEDEGKVRKPIQCLIDVGLGYLTLDQTTSSMSGGEIQRLKLATELNKEGRIYILDEPSTGLHYQDLQRLICLLRKLVKHNNTVIIVEHRLEMIAQTDYIIDIGPNGGSEGGRVIFTGTPQEIIHCKDSKTGKYLKNLTERNTYN